MLTTASDLAFTRDSGLRAAIRYLVVATIGFGVLLSAALARADNVDGTWSTLEDWPLIAIHAAITPDGRVLSYGTKSDGKQTGYFIYDVWDPTAGLTGGHMTLENMTLTDIFCSSQIILPQSGEILIAGGDNWTGTGTTNTGNNNSNLFDFGDNTLARSAGMNRSRWYSSSTALANGEIYIQGGSGGNDRPEVRQTDGAFRLLTGAPTNGYATLFPRNFLAPDGRVFGYDTNANMYFVDASGTGSIVSAGQFSSAYVGWTSGAAMFGPGKILQMGGNSSGATVIDINGPAPTVTPTASLSSRRHWVSATVLPNGHVLATGGTSSANQLIGVNNNAEIWNPATGQWHVGSAGAVARMYHSSALLLPDATVLVAGGGAPGPLNNTNAEIYYPPYLYAPGGGLATRPEIITAPDTANVGDSLAVQVDASTISRVTVVKTGSVTHSVNMDQRFIELPFQVSGNMLQVDLPVRASDTPPGYYMMFVIDDAGVPSLSSMLRINIDPTPNTAVDYTPAIGGGGGGEFQLACNVDEILVGVHGKFDTYVNQIGPQCVKMDQFGHWIGDPVDRPVTGTTTSGTSFSKSCARDSAMSGFQGRAGQYVNQIDIECRALTSAGGLSGAGQFLGGDGGPGGTARGPFRCDTDNPAYALYGRSGGWLDSFGLQCRQGAITPISVNSDPVVANPGSQSGVIGVAVNLQINASDGDGDTLIFSSTGLPPGLSINAGTGLISGTPTSDGTFSVEVSVTDGTAADSKIFEWLIDASPPLSVDPMSAQAPQEVDTVINFTASSSGGVNVVYKWDLGAGEPETAYSSSPTVSHTYTDPGIYYVTLTVNDDAGVPQIQTFVQAVHLPHTANRPASSTNITFEDRGAGSSRIWVVNQDNDSVTGFDAVSHVKVAEISVDDAPRSIAIAPDGRIWVANKSSASISVVDPNTLGVVQSITLPFASQPYGLVFSPVRNEAYVVLQATGDVLKLDASSGGQLGSVNAGPNVRHLAIDAEGGSLYISRFVTPRQPGEETATVDSQIGGVNTGGEILVADSATMAVATTIVLQHQPSDLVDAEDQGRGVPNYVGAVAISPDGTSARVPSKLDNIARGELRDPGFNLNFQNTVRAISSRIDLGTNTEDFARRLDYDNASLSSAAIFDPSGVYAFVALETSQEVVVVDAYAFAELFRIDVGHAPQGLAISPDGMRLYVNNFMDRTVDVFDLTTLQTLGQWSVSAIGTLPTVTTEALSADVLQGKKLFYDARDTRLARDRYLSCASCHNDGSGDGRVWDLTGFGEGLRNTIDLRGVGADHGRAHWSGNFDEIQDFEGQIRALSDGTGLMSDTDFNTGTRSEPLGDPKAGISADLDALAAYVASLDDYAPSPFRNSDGSLTVEGDAGQEIFRQENCAECHGGVEFTDSSSNTLHDIGTIKTSSGLRLGGTLTGFDTPTLRGVWDSAPYLHDGSAATLADAIAAHNDTSLGAGDMTSLVAYLQQIDTNETSAPAPATSTEGLVAAYDFDEGTGNTAVDGSGNGNTGSIAGASWTSGRSGGALSFDGVDDLVMINTAASLDLGAQMTLEAWVRPTAEQYGRRTAIYREGNYYALYASHNSRRSLRPSTSIKTGSSARSLNSGESVPAGAWSHLAATYDGAQLNLYINGILINSRDLSGDIKSTMNPLWIGGNSLYGQYFNGLIDDVRVYNRALSSAEIQADMTTPVGDAPPADITDPNVTIITPTGNDTYVSNTASLNLGGTASDDMSVTEVSWSSDQGSFGTAAGTAAWTINGIALNSGLNLITVTASDAAGNSSNDTLEVTYTPPDTAPPSVTISSPTGNDVYASSASLLNLGGTASDDTAVTAVNWTSDQGGAGSAVGTASWTINGIALAVGLNVITVTAEDAVGNSSSDTLQVTYTPPDTTPPSVTITSPTGTDTYVSDAPIINLGGTAFDETAVAEVTWESDSGDSGVAAGTTAWTIDSLLLQAGTNTITVTASDSAGNTNNDTLEISYTPPDNSGGLVVAYDFDEGAGDTLLDGSGNGNTGSIAGASWTSGRSGGALSFDGVDDLVVINTAASLDLGAQMTLEAWVRPTVEQLGRRTVVYREGNYYALYAGHNSRRSLRPSTSIKTGSSARSLNSGESVPAGAWSHLAATYDGAQLNLYINGILINSRDLSGDIKSTTNPLWIGGNSLYGHYFNGLIDDVRIYNRALSPAEIQADMVTPVGL